jgi:drug/metabolite transporter (DMT)-like permease
MADPQERAERAVSMLMRLGISLVMPIWALAMLLLGLRDRSGWWIIFGLIVGGLGALFFVGSPLTDPIFKDRRL